MESGPAPPAPSSHDLRRRILIRLGVAAALLAGVTIAWQVLDRAEPQTVAPQAKGPAPIDSAREVAAAAPRVIAGATTQEPEPPTQAATSPTASGTEAIDKEDKGAVVVAPVIVPLASPKPKLAKGPYLQVGVFMHPANADALKAKLEAQGIPVHFATRVQVGPFHDTKEAELMREKLKAMGLSSLLINQ